MTAIAIVQARMGSTRLPGKVLARLAGRPMIEHVLARAARIPRLNGVWLATSAAPTDDPLADAVAALGVPVFRGSEFDVLERYAQAAQAAGADIVVRVTADCPLLSPAVAGRVLARLLDQPGELDYVSNVQTRTFPRGLDVEAFTRSALEQARVQARQSFEREHVTPYLYRSGRFRLGEIRDQTRDGAPRDGSAQRWTVDVPADLELVQRIYDALWPVQPEFEYEDVLALLEAHPGWRDLNRDVPQKPLTG